MSFRKSDSISSIDRIGGTIRKRYRNMNIWRSNSLISLTSMRNRSDSVLESLPAPDDVDYVNEDNGLLSRRESSLSSSAIVKSTKGGWNTVVNVVLIEAKGLPDPPDDGFPHSLYCKIRLGSEKMKSKSVENTAQPEWRERFKLHLYNDHVLRISLWEKKKVHLMNITKAKQKNFMGSCVLDLSQLDKERTHEIWQELDDGYGSVHLSVTMCTIRTDSTVTTIDTPTNFHPSVDDLQRRYDFFNLGTEWNVAGQVHVKVITAKGLSGKPNAYCTVELDNQRVETQCARATPEPEWNKSYVFNIYDVTSTLDLKVWDSALVPSMRECLGRVSVPLLRVRNREVRWYALKDRSSRNIAKGNCPRILLEISVFFNPIKAALKLFRPKDVRYIRRTSKFNIALVYRNVEFIGDALAFAAQINEAYKRLFEWDNKELCYMTLPVWLLFWYHFQLFMAPLLLLLPFIYFRLYSFGQKERSFMRGYSSVDEPAQGEPEPQNFKSLTGRIQDVPEMTLTITNGIDYIASVAERLYNLATFKVPFLSYLTIVLLVIASVVLFYIPFNYLLMALGVYKYARKQLNPERTLNNDLLDFISRIPDTETLKDWKELSVPEPQLSRVSNQPIRSS